MLVLYIDPPPPLHSIYTRVRCKCVWTSDHMILLITGEVFVYSSSLGEAQGGGAGGPLPRDVASFLLRGEHLVERSKAGWHFVARPAGRSEAGLYFAARAVRRVKIEAGVQGRSPGGGPGGEALGKFYEI